MTNEAFEALFWCLAHFRRLDESNAAIHCAPVRYSPITFRIAEVLCHQGHDEHPDVSAVVDHIGEYQEDKGR